MKPVVLISPDRYPCKLCTLTDQEYHVVNLNHRVQWVRVIPDRNNEAPNGSCPTTDPSWYCAPIYSRPKVVRQVLSPTKISQEDPSFSQDIVIASHYTNDGSKENREQ
jgi:hypothetical protein